jgi:hypothetical protein
MPDSKEESMITQQVKRRGRPPKDPDLAVSRGIMIQPRFPRVLYRQMKEASAEEGLAITAWVRHLVYVALAERKKKSST